MKEEQALNIVAMALTASPEALKGILRERVTLVETSAKLIEAMEEARTACGCHTLKPAPPTPCAPCAILDAAIVRYKR